MNLHDYTHIIRHPEHIGPAETDALDAIVAEFPYFQSARALRLKGLRNQDSFRYNFALKVAAAYTRDRSVLFDFITSDAFVSMNRDAVTAAETQVETPLEAPVEPLYETPETEDAEALHFAPEADEPAEHTTPSPPAETAAETEIPEPKRESDPLSDSIRSSIETATQTAVHPETLQTKPEPESEEPEEISELRENLSVGKPLEFTPTEKHSFAEWLQLATLKPIQRDTENAAEANEDPREADRQKKIEIIDRFIEANPKITPVKPTSPAPPVIFEPSRAVDNSYLMTETLARVYLEQQKYDKAIQAYEILILKYPEKSSFFADRILDIRSLKKNNTKSE